MDSSSEFQPGEIRQIEKPQSPASTLTQEEAETKIGEDAIGCSSASLRPKTPPPVLHKNDPKLSNLHVCVNIKDNDNGNDVDDDYDKDDEVKIEAIIVNGRLVAASQAPDIFDEEWEEDDSWITLEGAKYAAEVRAAEAAAATVPALEADLEAGDIEVVLFGIFSRAIRERIAGFSNEYTTSEYRRIKAEQPDDDDLHDL